MDSKRVSIVIDKETYVKIKNMCGRGLKFRNFSHAMDVILNDYIVENTPILRLDQVRKAAVKQST